MRRDLVEQAMAGDHSAFSELARASIARLYASAHDFFWQRVAP